MDILGIDPGDGHIVSDGDSDQSGQAEKPDAAASPEPSGTKDRASQTPEIPKEAGPLPHGPAQSPGKPGKSSFRPYKGFVPKLKVGYKCLNCPHTHMDHSHYNPRGCLIGECTCIGMKLDPKDIPSRMD